MLLIGSGPVEGSQTAREPSETVIMKELPDRIQVWLGKSLFTEYVFSYPSRPYLYPIYGPAQAPMTRNWPMVDAPGESKDHPHQRSLWFAHGKVNGIDFWSELPGAGSVKHRKFEAVESAKDHGTIKTANDWVDKDGKLICTDERTMRFSVSKINKTSRIIDFEITIRASEGELIFGDTKEGTMGIRIAESMKVAKGSGHIINSEGLRDGQAWGKRAKWCDYFGSIGPNAAGIAIFDHPSNPRFPTWWHVRDYGLFAANPFGKHDFESLPDKAAGELKLPAGSALTFKYRFLFHEGNEKQGQVGEEYACFAK